MVNQQKYFSVWEGALVQWLWEETHDLKVLCSSPGLVVMGGDSRSKGPVFESQHQILDAYFHIFFAENIVMFVYKTKINDKEAGDGPLIKNISESISFQRSNF